MTLFGESAGSMSISMYAFRYVTDPLVAGMIMQSGFATAVQTDNGTEWVRVSNNTGCIAQSGGDTAKELKCMRNVTARELKMAVSPHGLVYFADPVGGTPRVDNETFFTPQEYYTRSAAGKFAKIVRDPRHTFLFLRLLTPDPTSLSSWVTTMMRANHSFPSTM
jgi:carboxylesterase type B